MTEKPDVQYAKEALYTICGKEKKYYSVFGEYILTKDVFKKLKEDIESDNKDRGEFQLTTALDYVREKDGMVAFIPDGKMFDIGNVDSYKKTFMKKLK